MSLAIDVVLKLLYPLVCLGSNGKTPAIGRGDRVKGLRAILCVAVIAMSARLATCELLRRVGAAKMPDSELYQALAESVVAGRGLNLGDDGAKRAPGYPLFIATSWTLLGKDENRFLILQALIGTASCCLVYQFGREIDRFVGKTGVGFIAGLLLAVEPFTLVIGGLVLSETVHTCFLLLSVFPSLLAITRDRLPSKWTWFLGGICWGVATLTRPSGLFLTPLLWLCCIGKLGRSSSTFTAICIGIVGFVLTCSPWWIRNAVRYGMFVPTTLNVGESLYDGLNPDANGSSKMEFVETPAVRQLDEVTRDRHWRSQALEFVRDQPARVLSLALTKFFRFWSPWPNESRFQRLDVVAITSLFSIPFFVLAIWGAVELLKIPRGFPLWIWLVLPAAYFCGLHMIFVSSVRYRVPATPMLALLAGIGISAIGRLHRSGQTK